MKPTVLVISCEHAVNYVPPTYQHLFANHTPILSSHRAYDLGAIDIATQLQKNLHCDVIQADVTKLLVDCNHSMHHSLCFSKFTKKLPISDKKNLIEQHYLPFQQRLGSRIADHIAEHKQVLHISIHSFSPILDGFIQNASIGVLYDSHRHGEKEVARLINSLLLQETVPYRVRLNYPFSGSKDHVLNQFRKQYDQKDYLGIKMEVNQALLSDVQNMMALCGSLSNTLSELLDLL